MASYKLNTAPASEPLTTAEAKSQLNIPTSETYWDTYIDTLITTARQQVEQITYRGLITQTWTLYLDYSEFTSTIIEISKVPVQSITSVKYYDMDGNLQTMDASNYITDLVATNGPARIQLLTIPAVKDRINAVEIQFVCGWTSAANVPTPIKHAMKLIIGHLFEHREDVVFTSSPTTLPMGAMNLLKPYSMNWFYRGV